MSLQDWLNNRWIRRHKVTPGEVAQLREIVDRDLKDAGEKGLSPDWRFGIAYNAALKLCTILLYAEGFRPEKNRANFRTLKSLPLILGPQKNGDANYLDACRIKRNTVEYDYVGGATESDADELIRFCKNLRKEVDAWMQIEHPELL